MGWPQVPQEMCLKILRQFSQADDLPTRLGALPAAAGIPDEGTGRLHLTARDREPPKAAVELHRQRPELPEAG